MKPSALYALRTLGPNTFGIGKFDEDYNLLASYVLSPSGAGYACDCPASARSVKLKPCKHQKMLRVMLGSVNTGRFYDPENGRWIEAIQMELPGIETETTLPEVSAPFEAKPVEIESEAPSPDDIMDEIEIAELRDGVEKDAMLAELDNRIAEIEAKGNIAVGPNSSMEEQRALIPEVAGSSPASAATAGIRRRI